MAIITNYGNSNCPQEQRIVGLLKGLDADGYLAQNILMPDKDCPKMPNEHDIVLIVPWGAYSIESKKTDGVETLKLEGNNPDEWKRAKWLLGSKDGRWHKDPLRRRNARWTAWRKGQILLSFIRSTNPHLSKLPVQGVVVFSDMTAVEASANDSGIGGRWCNVRSLLELITQDRREYAGPVFDLADLSCVFKKLEALPSAIGEGTVIHNSRLRSRREGFREIGCTIPVYCYDATHEVFDEDLEARIYDLTQLDQASARFFVRMKRRLNALDRANDPCVIRVRDIHEWMEGYLVSYERFEGASLRNVMREYSSGMPRGLAVSVIANIAETVSRLHRGSQPIIHLDIRPETVWLGGGWREGGGNPHKLHGFTNPRLNREDISRAHSLGTFGDSFVAPEIREPSEHEPPSPSQDVYSLGALLAYCLMGERAYSTALGDKDVVRPATADRNLDSLIARAAARWRGDRFRDVDEFLGVLRAQAV